METILHDKLIIYKHYYYILNKLIDYKLIDKLYPIIYKLVDKLYPYLLRKLFYHKEFQEFFRHLSIQLSRVRAQ